MFNGRPLAPSGTPVVALFKLHVEVPGTSAAGVVLAGFFFDTSFHLLHARRREGVGCGGDGWGAGNERPV